MSTLQADPVTAPPRAAFRAKRLASTTFVVEEYADTYGEHPLLYAKIFLDAQTILLLDTGCGGATYDDEIRVRSIRTFLETVPVKENENRPLNEGGVMSYLVVLSHCHYDHILGVEQFGKDSTILASGHDPSFTSRENLPRHSLCEALGIATPQYTSTLVPHLHVIQSHYPESIPTPTPVQSSTGPMETQSPVTRAPIPLGVQVLHTPGHTPDELALWDETDQILYVGDTLYERAHIIFPSEGSIVEWFRSVDALIDLVAPFPQAQIVCGHETAGKPAADVLSATKVFMRDVVGGKELVKSRFEKRGETCVEYVQQGSRFSLICPERLVEEARQACLTI